MNRTTNYINKNINFIWSFFISISIALVLMAFASWNMTTLKLPKNIVYDLKNVRVDSCTFDGHNIKVVGWAFNDGESLPANRVFALKKNGELVEVMTSVAIRSDVTRYIGGTINYDRTGFTASKKVFNLDDFTKEIKVISEDLKGVGHAKDFTCK